MAPTLNQRFLDQLSQIGANQESVLCASQNELPVSKPIMTATSTSTAETHGSIQPKTRTQENFPVGSFLIPKSLRADVHAYYTFARLADDVADSSSHSSHEKIAILDQMEAVVLHNQSDKGLLDEDVFGAAELIGHRLRERSSDLRLATDLLVAFRLDAENKRCRTWADLMDYCRFSACPVGRFLLALHGESDGYAESDALCSALQVLNHIQDLQDDYVVLKRVYIPQDWMDHDKCSLEDLAQKQTNMSLRICLNRMIEQTDRLLDLSSPLPKRIRHRGLAAEADICIGLAHSLSQRLKRGDPLARRIKLSPYDWFTSGLHSLMYLLRP